MDFVLKDLGRKLGRRAHERCSVPGALVSWMLEGQESFPDARWPMSDISRAGLSFLTNEPPEIGSTVSIRIFLPQNETIELNGSVVYSLPRGPRLTYRYRVGVESKAIAQLEAEHSPHLLKIIEASERKNAKAKKN
jgi:hypothetical protein